MGLSSPYGRTTGQEINPNVRDDRQGPTVASVVVIRNITQ